MPNTIQRQAKTRRDSGELNRDQKRARERDANKPAPELGPGHWVRRGIQPEVESPPPSGFTRLMRLAAEIREEHNPAVRVRLEARYRQESIAVADLTLDPQERHLRETIKEVLATLAGIMDGGDLTQPECWSRREWLEFHKNLVVCHRRSTQWLTTSRRFGAERWGQGHVADAEQPNETKITTSPT